ncbi:MAG: hypothetical protein AB1634_00645 [Thermodesulfobacteriota bacterium]
MEEGKETRDAEAFHRRALEEVEIVRRHHDDDEELLCELGIGWAGRGVRLLRSILDRDGSRDELLPRARQALQEAETAFATGEAVSPTGYRSGFWLIHTRALLATVVKEQEAGAAGAGEIAAFDPYPGVAAYLFRQRGWLQPPVPSATETDAAAAASVYLRQRLGQAMEVFSKAVLNQGFKPNLRLALATLVWDVTPAPGEAEWRQVMAFLKKARQEVAILDRHRLGVYSNTHFVMQMQSTADFLRCLDLVSTRVTALRDQGASPTAAKGGGAPAGASSGLETSPLPFVASLIKRKIMFMCLAEPIG